MKTKNIIALFAIVAEIGMGIVFLMNSATDIQFGFGIVLLTQGIIHLTK